MENSKPGNHQTGPTDEEKPSTAGTTDSSSSSILTVTEQGDSTSAAIVPDNVIPSRPSGTPFTSLSQVDADLVLARTLQEQERAYMMLRMNVDGSDYGSWEAGSYVHEDNDEFDEHDEDDEYEGSNDDDDVDGEDAFDVHAHPESEDGDNQGVELDAAAFPSDEAYARALQDAEDRSMAARLLALSGINGMALEESDDSEDHGANSQDTWEDVDPDELSYEELLALGEVVGTESRGLSADSIASLPSVIYTTQSKQNDSNDTCVICRLDYEDGDRLTLLSCKHSYHSECITNWLQINKVCPVCSAEVSTSGSS